MVKVPNAVEILPKITTAWVGCTSVTDRQTTTDGRATVNMSSRSLRTVLPCYTVTDYVRYDFVVVNSCKHIRKVELRCILMLTCACCCILHNTQSMAALYSLRKFCSHRFVFMNCYCLNDVHVKPEVRLLSSAMTCWQVCIAVLKFLK